MDKLPRSAQPKPRSPRLVWLRFPLLAALLVNLVLILRVPLVQITQGREASQQVAVATIDPPSDQSSDDPAQPVVAPAPLLSSGGAAQPSLSSQSNPPRPSLSTASVSPPRDPAAVDLEPAARLAMICLGEYMAQTNAARDQLADDLALHIAQSVGRLGADDPIETSPSTPADPPQAAVAPPAVSVDPPPAVAIEPPSINPPRTNPRPQPRSLAQSGQSDKSPAALPVPDEHDPPQPPAAEKVNIVLRNAPDSQNVFHFVLDGRVISLKPGEWRRIETSGRHIVRFHRGAEFGYAEHALVNGNYEFRVSNSGWRIVKDGESR